jgi:hypothetical protein
MELGWKRWTGRVACVVIMNYYVAVFRMQSLKRKEDDIKVGLRELWYEAVVFTACWFERQAT